MMMMKWETSTRSTLTPQGSVASSKALCGEHFTIGYLSLLMIMMMMILMMIMMTMMMMAIIITFQFLNDPNLAIWGVPEMALQVPESKL